MLPGQAAGQILQRSALHGDEVHTSKGTDMLGARMFTGARRGLLTGCLNEASRANEALVQHHCQVRSPARTPGLEDPKVLCRGHSHTRTPRDGPVLQEGRAAGRCGARQSCGGPGLCPHPWLLRQKMLHRAGGPFPRVTADPRGWGHSSSDSPGGTENGTNR